jgi:integrase
MRTENRTGRGRPSTGSLILRKSGYWAKLTITVEGERVRKAVQLHTHDKAVARRKMARIAAAAARGTLALGAAPSEAKRAETYAVAAARLRAERRAEGKRAVEDEERADRLHILPVIGELAVTDVRPAHIREILETARDNGLSGKTLLNIRAAASVVFDSLWREEQITENPVKRAPRVHGTADRRERAVLTDDELALYLAWEHPDPRFHVFVEQRQTMSVIARMFGGARTGDLHALRWESFDLPGFAFGWVPRQKTERPQKLAIVPALRPFLERWWRRMGSPAEGLVFPRLIGSGAGETAKSGSKYAEELRRDIKRAMGLEVCEAGRWVERVGPDAYSQRQRELFTETEYTKPVDFHSWRRAFNQALADAGASAQQAAALAGHASLEAHAKYLKNTAKAAAMPEGAIPRLVLFSSPNKDENQDDPSESFANIGGGAGSRTRQVPDFVHDFAVSLGTDEADTDVCGPSGHNVASIPPGGLTLADLLAAADRAMVAGDVHGARRLLAEAAGRQADQRGDRDADTGVGKGT